MPMTRRDFLTGAATLSVASALAAEPPTGVSDSGKGSVPEVAALGAEPVSYYAAGVYRVALFAGGYVVVGGKNAVGVAVSEVTDSR